jgi:hypothetical protein
MIGFQIYRLVVTALTFLVAEVTISAESRPTPHLAPASAPKSEFVVRIDYGKDPFFPKSTRLHSQGKDSESEAVTPSVPDFILVKGISFTKERKLAIINNYTVAEGEEFNLRRGGKLIRVKCVEIKDGGVVVAVDGATKTILLKRN